MPEVIASSSELSIPTGHSSETDLESTDRSTNGTKAGASAMPMKIMPAQVTFKKARVSGPRYHKKRSPLKFTSPLKKTYSSTTISKLQLKVPSALLTPSTPLKHKIPRGLLSSSTSSTSVTTHPPSTTSPSLSPTPSPRATPVSSRLQLVRQNASLHFRSRKSVSQMDLKQARRSVKFQVPQRNDCINARNADLKGTPSTVFTKNEDMYVLDEADPKLASMKIYAMIMLNAWRKRRDDVKRLTEQVNDFKRSSTKARSQIHVLNTLFRVEQKRNDELGNLLKRSQEELKKMQFSCESISASLVSAQNEKDFLEEQLKYKEKELDDVNTILGQTKSELFQTMAEHRRLQSNMCMEQRKMQLLENQNRDLISELTELNHTTFLKEEMLLDDIQSNKANYDAAQDKIRELEEKAARIREIGVQISDYAEANDKLAMQIQSMRSEIDTLQACLAATVSNRLKTCWHTSLGYKKAVLHVLHWAAFCVLPATPAPEIPDFPIQLLWGKVMSIVCH